MNDFFLYEFIVAVLNFICYLFRLGRDHAVETVKRLRHFGIEIFRISRTTIINSIFKYLFKFQRNTIQNTFINNLSSNFFQYQK